MPDPRKEVVSLLLLAAGVRCPTSQLPLSSSGKWAEKCLFPGRHPPQGGVRHRESEPRYVGAALVLTIGMIKQIVYLFYSHLLRPGLQTSFVVGVDKKGTFSNCRDWSPEEHKGSCERGEREVRATLSVSFLPGSLVTPHGSLSALKGPEWPLNPRPEDGPESQPEGLCRRAGTSWVTRWPGQRKQERAGEHGGTDSLPARAG